jgi:hypothetical protein
MPLSQTNYINVSRPFLPTSKTTVYAAELLGILYSIITAVTARDIERATLFVDNQAAIQSVHSPGGQSGQLIPRQIIHLINNLRKRGVSVPSLLPSLYPQLLQPRRFISLQGGPA